MESKTRTLYLVIDGLALIGVLAFSVLAALYPDSLSFVILQILCAGLILGSVILLRQPHDR